MKPESKPPVPPMLLEKFLDWPSPYARGFASIEHELLDEKQVHVFVASTKAPRFWGGEESELFADMASKMESLIAACSAITRAVESLTAKVHSSKVVPVEHLTENLILKRPIFAVVEESEGMVTATHYECEIFGQGDAEFEALDDLRESLAEYYLQLEQSAEQLGPLPTKHLRILSDLIREA